MDDIMVSVICLTYNHEKYIRQCLESLVNQQTSFKYEVFVHDDASTDGTTEIIREYEKKYPTIIRPIYQSENQYSKGVTITNTYIIPKARGKYLAWCEGDDSWISENKLQEQVGFLETHLDYSCCLHNVCFQNLYNGDTYNVPGIKKARDYGTGEIIRRGCFFQISSLVMRKDLYLEKPAVFIAKGFGDWPLFIYGSICGKLHVFSDTMSLHRHGVPGSWTERIKSNVEMAKTHNNSMIEMLSAVDSFYAGFYSKEIGYAIRRAEYNLAKNSEDKTIMHSRKYLPFYLAEIKKNFYSALKACFPWLVRIKRRLFVG